MCPRSLNHYSWIGVSAGFETTFEKNSKHAYGFAVGAEVITSEDGFALATYNYHFNGFSNPGLVIGTAVGLRTNITPLGKDEKEPSFILTFNVGYKF